jgi:hypothetical protein
MSKIKNIELIETDPDYIDCPKYGNSIRDLISKNPEGVADHVICKSLHIGQDKLDEIYQNAIKKLQKRFK